MEPTNGMDRMTTEVVIPRRPLVARAGLVVGVLVLGVGLTAGVQLLRPTPGVAEPEIIVARTIGMVAAPEDVQTVLRGLGTARPHRSTRIAPQVGGVVVEVNPRMESGNIIRAGDLLFRIDADNFALAVASREAEISRLESELARLATEKQNEERRLDSTRVIRDIAVREFERMNRLVTESGAESEARLDAVRALMEREERTVIEGENSLALFDVRQRSIEAQVAAARALLAQARLDLERTEVRAPFTGRVKHKTVELGQKVNVGVELLTLADDRVLEIPVSLDSREVARWLNVEADPDDLHWFNAFEDYPVRVRWSEVPGSLAYVGRLDRIEDYDSRTRTFHIVARVEGERDDSVGIGPNGVNFPLTEGMFVEVEIPGRLAESVVSIPREAIDSQGNVYVSVDGRLETRPVTVARIQDNVALISEGIQPGEIVLLRRPPLAVEGMRLEVTIQSPDSEYIGESLPENGMAVRL